MTSIYGNQITGISTLLCSLNLFTDTTENLLYVLWRHLRFYLVYCKPTDVGGDLGLPGVGRVGMRRMQGEDEGCRVLGGGGGGGGKEGGGL